MKDIPECCKEESKEQFEKYQARRDREAQFLRCIMSIHEAKSCIENIMTQEIKSLFNELLENVKKLKEEKTI